MSGKLTMGSSDSSPNKVRNGFARLSSAVSAYTNSIYIQKKKEKLLETTTFPQSIKKYNCCYNSICLLNVIVG